MDVRGWTTRALRHPARIVPVAFLGGVAAGTALLMLPAARAGPGHAPVLVAAFTATSAVCVGGLNITDTGRYWSTFGEAIITVLTKLGGFGIVAMAFLLTLLVSRRLALRNRLVLRAEGTGLGLGNVRRVLFRVALVSVCCELTVAVVLAARFWSHYDYPPGRAAWYGLFHAVQAFNNCGFSLFNDSLAGFVGDAWICLPLSLGVIVGSTGFPVLLELGNRWRSPNSWSVHTRLTVGGSLTLLVIGFLALLATEWANQRTFGPLGVPAKVLAAFTQSTMSRSGGLSSVDIGGLEQESIAIVIGLMFIGGGTASTAGGIKVTTFFLLAFVMWAEVRGEPDVVIGRRRIATATQRQALTIALLGVALATAGTLLLIALTSHLQSYQALFETVSALSTTGLSTGITANLPAAAQLLLAALMFIGRVGTVAAASALALNTRHRLYRYPEERPLVG